ncbi:uncharacterized protein LOC130998207 [Salvia miltiorrhiza]|uniref:uncharacterized protein LOC130998207 n=1 Tax=Salvia miltiorrhiza TaxID=226208 RepID=UPI0025ACF76B|nr:uncharacterized protein LOC130998207 [Salvia miltiorrhiza]
MWLRDERCGEFCKELWQTGGAALLADDVSLKIQMMGRELKLWESRSFGRVKKRCSEIRKELAELQKPSLEASTKDDQRALENELDELLQREDVMWKQRSRTDWMAEGDRNTSYFHKVAEGRRSRNHIREIKMVDGRVTRKNEEMDEVFRSYFQELFTLESPHNPDVVLQSIEPVVTEEMNRELTASYTQEEIVQALKQIHPLKAPGPDGMSVVFYNSCWSSARFEVVPILLDILNNGATPRLKRCLPSIIHESQSAFVPGRHITDNAILAFEIFHMMKINKAKDHGVFAYKLDMAKVTHLCRPGVYDKAILYPIFLFLMCAEALSGLLRQAETRGLVHGARLCRTAPRVSHLLFADDFIIFGRANQQEINVVKEVLREYEEVSGQKVNLDKSTISFSGGVATAKQEALAIQMGVGLTGCRSNYLGIPSIVGRSKTEIFQMLVDRTRKKSKDWKRKFLSRAGKTVLIKAVLQSIPTYLMSCFALPE